MKINNFPVTHDRAFLRHFLTRFRVISLSPEMVELLKAESETDPYAAYGYARWLSCVNPEKDSLDKAEALLMWAMQDVPDAKAALALMHYDGRLASGKAAPGIYDLLMRGTEGEWSELRQVIGLQNGIFGDHGIKKDTALVADILRGQIEKHPDVDTLYYDLLGCALEDDEPEAAEEAFRTVIAREDAAGYYGLANLLRKQGRLEEADAVAKEGSLKGDFRCRRLWAQMEDAYFEKLPSERRKTLYKEIADGLDYAIAHHDLYSCYCKGAAYYLGNLGFEQDCAKALEPLQRGLEMGEGRCPWLLAIIQESGALPAELQKTPAEIACLYLQAVRLGENDLGTLQKVAEAYVCGLLPDQEEEIEHFHLKTFMDTALEVDEGPDATGVVTVYPEGFYYAWDAEEELDLDELAQRLNARGFDVVHFSPLLTRLTKALTLDGCHIAMLVDKDGYAKDLPDNMTGTLVYGRGAEMRGPVTFVLETDKGYELQPLKGFQRIYLLIQLLGAATGGLLRQPTSEDAERIGAPDSGGFEEYDDDENDEPLDAAVPLSELDAALEKVNLCHDTLYLTLPDEPRYSFVDTEDLFRPIKRKLEANIEAHGGYMIDEWRFVDERQVPMDLRSCVRFL